MEKNLRKNKIQRAHLSWLISQFRPYRLQITGLLLLQCVVSLLSAVSVIVNKYLVDRATDGLGLSWGITIMLLATALTVIINLFVQMWMITFNEKCCFSIRTAVYKKLLRTRMQALRKFHSEDVLTRLTSDIEMVTGGALHILINGVGTVVKLISAFLLLYYYNAGLALAVLLITPIGMGTFLLLSGRMRYVQENYQKSEGAYRVFLQESLRNMEVVKAFSAEENSERKLEALRDERMGWTVKIRRLQTVTRTMVHVTFTMGTTLAFLVGVVQIAEKTISYGTMTAFLALVGQVQSPVLSLGEMARRMITILASVPRIMEIGELSQDEPAMVAVQSGPVTLRGEKITFAYENEEIFRDFSFTVAPGEKVAVTGQSGAGKTTLIKLLLGFALPQGGSLTIGDLPVCAATRQYFSYVPQGNTLFQGTIRENLLMADPDAGEADMWTALEMACAKDFVEKLPNGLDTPIGEKATGISEGQAQRIAIARAMLRKAPILIFDEATSALDEETEARILGNICNQKRDTAYIIITHRPQALQYCDKRIEI
ncbi:MAG: ABC transporter ATP-binding protein [Ruminococcaceae bacterium]|nr:ABC transporter ATP-binding protein [Oscillospiraceae bacterium]